MSDRVIAVDFDGTLCENKFPEIGNENKTVISELLLAQSEGAKLILWTCREGELLERALKWCYDRGLEFDAINDSLPEWKERFGNNPRKVGATEYWDDRAVCKAYREHAANAIFVGFDGSANPLFRCGGCGNTVIKGETKRCSSCGIRWVL